MRGSEMCRLFLSCSGARVRGRGMPMTKMARFKSVKEEQQYTITLSWAWWWWRWLLWWIKVGENNVSPTAWLVLEEAPTNANDWYFSCVNSTRIWILPLEYVLFGWLRFQRRLCSARLAERASQSLWKVRNYTKKLSLSRGVLSV